MTDPTPLTQAQIREIQRMLAEAISQQATSQRLTEQYVRYLVLGNGGGLLACLTFAGGLVKDRISTAIPIQNVALPMWCFLIGLIFGVLIVSIQRAQAAHFAETNARGSIDTMKKAGAIIADPKPAFSKIEQRGLPHLTAAINICGLISQFAFFAGAIWGMIRISSGG